MNLYFYVLERPLIHISLVLFLPQCHAPCAPGTLPNYQATRTLPDSPNHLTDRFPTTRRSSPITRPPGGQVYHPAADSDPDALDERHRGYVSFLPLFRFIYTS